MFSSLDRITIDPEIFQGQPCIRGMRIPVSLVLKCMAAGKKESEIMEDYPELEQDDIRQCIEYAAWLASERTISVAGLKH